MSETKNLRAELKKAEAAPKDKTTSMTIETKASMKDIIWATIQTASERLKDRPGKTALVEFDVNGCHVECIVKGPQNGL